MKCSIWEDEDGGCCVIWGVELTPESRKAAGQNPRCVHVFDASSYVDVLQKWNDYYGWGPYRPMLMDNGGPYPEDVAPFTEDCQ